MCAPTHRRSVSDGSDIYLLVKIPLLLSFYFNKCVTDEMKQPLLYLPHYQGLRTIGVLTKPDLVGPGNEQEVLEVREFVLSIYYTIRIIFESSLYLPLKI